MLSDTLLWGYFELNYKLNGSYEYIYTRKLRFKQLKHFLNREFPDNTFISLWSLIIGGLTGLSISAYMLESDPQTTMALGILIGLMVGNPHFIISKFFWKLRLFKLIQFKKKILPLDEKYTYLIKDETVYSSKAWELFFESYLFINNEFLSIEEREVLKALCFEHIEELRIALKSDVNKYSELTDTSKELFQVKWSTNEHLNFKYAGDRVRHHDLLRGFHHFDGAHLFYHIQQPYPWKSDSYFVDFVILSTPECYLLKLT